MGHSEDEDYSSSGDDDEYRRGGSRRKTKSRNQSTSVAARSRVQGTTQEQSKRRGMRMHLVIRKRENDEARTCFAET